MRQNDRVPDVPVPVTLCAGCWTPYTVTAFRQLGALEPDGAIERRACLGCGHAVCADLRGVEGDLYADADRVAALFPEQAAAFAPRPSRWSRLALPITAALLGLLVGLACAALL